MGTICKYSEQKHHLRFPGQENELEKELCRTRNSIQRTYGTNMDPRKKVILLCNYCWFQTPNCTKMHFMYIVERKYKNNAIRCYLGLIEKGFIKH